MDTHKINIKLFAESDTFKPTEFVPIFHRWIQTQSLDGHLLIDVADYAHVPAGPGTLVVASEANIHMDRGENRLGLLYVRKQPIAGATGTFREQLRGVLLEAIKAAVKMEDEPDLAGRLRFKPGEISIRLNDRLNSPNTVETFNAVKADVTAVLDELFGPGSTTIEHANASSPLQLFTIRAMLKTSATMPKFRTLLETTAAHS
jgi:hypothetical protein